MSKKDAYDRGYDDALHFVSEVCRKDGLQECWEAILNHLAHSGYFAEPDEIDDRLKRELGIEMTQA